MNYPAETRKEMKVCRNFTEKSFPPECCGELSGNQRKTSVENIFRNFFFTEETALAIDGEEQSRFIIRKKLQDIGRFIGIGVGKTQSSQTIFFFGSS